MISSYSAYLKARRAGRVQTVLARGKSARQAVIFAKRRFQGRTYRGFDRVGQKELKYIDVSAGTAAGDTTGSVSCINLVATGTDLTNRIGRKINLKSYEIRGIVRPEDTLVTGANCVQTSHVRLMIIYDRAPTGTLPTITEILQASHSNSMLATENTHRFTVLSNWEAAIGPSVMDTTATQAVIHGSTGVPIHLYRKINLSEYFDGTTATQASVSFGALYLLTIGDQAAGAGATFTISSRVRFNDS